MFYLSFNIPNILFNKIKGWKLVSYEKSYYSKFKNLSRNKGLEFQIMKSESFDILDFNFRLSISGEDHAGLHSSFEIMGFGFEFNVYDNRHWNYEENRWYVEGEELEEVFESK